MIRSITTRTRGPIGRGGRQRRNRASKCAWIDAGKYHHAHHTPNRFTDKVKTSSVYVARKGEKVAPTSPRFRRLYYGRKLSDPNLGGGANRALPNVHSGETRRRAKQTRIVATSNGVRLRYSTNALNFRHPNSRVDNRAEFVVLLPGEEPEIADVYDRSLDRNLNSDNSTSTTRVS